MKKSELKQLIRGHIIKKRSMNENTEIDRLENELDNNPEDKQLKAIVRAKKFLSSYGK